MQPMSFLLPLKPFLTALVMPLCSGLLLIMVSMLWARRRHTPAQTKQVLLSLGALTALVLWVLSNPAVAVALAQHLLTPMVAVTPQDLKDQKVQAIVVLGGGALRNVPEYQGHVLPSESLGRLTYGLYLQKQTQLPLAYSGGVGWADSDGQTSEADVAADTLSRLNLPPMQWLERESKDTHQNAQFTHSLLKAQGVTRIALVTHAWHMPRALREFETAGFERVLPAPMGFIRIDDPSLLNWLPSAQGLHISQLVLREWLGMQVARLTGTRTAISAP